MANSHQIFTSTEEFLKYAVGKCVFCSEHPEATRLHLDKKHLQNAIYFTDENNEEKFAVSCFCKDGKQDNRSHFHCPGCNFKQISRPAYFLSHLKSAHGLHGGKKDLKAATIKTKDKADQIVDVNPNHIRCEVCNANFSSNKALRKHKRQAHQLDQRPMLCVDPINGIYITPQNDRGGALIPIHVVKCTSAQTMECELDTCRSIMKMDAASGNPGKECPHLEQTKYASPYVPPAPLSNNTLQEMCDKSLITTELKGKCEDLTQAASQNGVDCLFPFLLGEYGYSGRFLFFSVFTNLKDNWCRFRRTRVTFDSEGGKWHCMCQSIRHKAHRCVHRGVAMWWVYTHRPDLLAPENVCTNYPTETIDDLESYIIESSMPCTAYAGSTDKVRRLTEYLVASKRIPREPPGNLTSVERPVPAAFVPAEQTCPYCPGPTPPDLTSHTVMCSNATVYGIGFCKRGISVGVKQCPVCNNYVRFQEYSSGFHNFNDRVLLTLPLCYMLLGGLANNTANGRLLHILEFFNDVKYHHQTIRKGFQHFLSLLEMANEFTCNRCGNVPAVLLADTNWKVSFDIPVGNFKRPNPDDITDADLFINIEESWNSLENEVIAEGFLTGTSVRNPFTKDLAHSTLAPWMGKTTRAGDVLPKTEVKKALKRREAIHSSSQPKVTLKKMDEDIILNLIERELPSRGELVEACHILGVSGEGSITDLMNRLGELLNFKEVYPKLFIKLQKAGGGILHLSCMHGVVYYVNFLFWSESARDHVDALLSFHTFPTVFISDIAGQVARHMNNRTRQRFFQPFDGRLCEVNPDNLKKAAQKLLVVDLPWVQRLGCVPQRQRRALDRFTEIHPVTLTNDRFSLYDRFHQKNQRRPEEKLRSLNICPDLRTEINSSVAEQLNRELSSIKYSLCVMGETHFKHSVRAIMTLHNEKINTKFFNKMRSHTTLPVSVGSSGTLSVSSVAKTNQPHERPPKMIESSNVAGPHAVCYSSDIYKISLQQKEKLEKVITQPKEKVLLRYRRSNLNVDDLCHICPLSLVQGWRGAGTTPWLTGDGLDSRVEQIVQNVQDVQMLPVHVFILWSRQMQQTGQVQPDTRKYLEGITPMSKVLLLRCVGHDTVETGNHFIMWVLDGPKEEIRVYDSLSLYTTISPEDINILGDALQNIWTLRDWSVCYTSQWRQRDSDNCGIAVCCAAEIEAKGQQMSNQSLSKTQWQKLRLYHGSCLADAVDEKELDPVQMEIEDWSSQEYEVSLGDDMAFDGEQGQERPRAKLNKETCMSVDTNTCVYLFTDVRKLADVLLPCKDCGGVVHQCCANVTDEYRCGCTIPPTYDLQRTKDALEEKGLRGLLTEAEIKKLDDDLWQGKLMSHRMNLYLSPGRHTKERRALFQFTIFDDITTDSYIDILASWANTDYKADLSNPDFLICVLFPEACIRILQRYEEISRHCAEDFLAMGLKIKE